MKFQGIQTGNICVTIKIECALVHIRKYYKNRGGSL